MKRRERRADWISRLCERLGRRTIASGFLDRVSAWVIPAPAIPRMNAAPRGGATLGPDMMLAQGPNLDPTYHGTAPTTPAQPHDDDSVSGDIGVLGWITCRFSSRACREKQEEADRKAGKDGCDDPRYRGMSGRPCRFSGGTDLKCPSGTKSGWFWSYDTPVGRIFYVDCCGGSPQGSVVCHWTNEPNWCMGWGRAQNAGITAYNCTLAIPDSLMRTRDLGGGRYEVVGVDA